MALLSKIQTLVFCTTKFLYFTEVLLLWSTQSHNWLEKGEFTRKLHVSTNRSLCFQLFWCFFHKTLPYEDNSIIKEVLAVLWLEFSQQRKTHEGFRYFTITQKR